MQSLRDVALEFVLADRLPERLTVVEGLRHPPARPLLEPETFEQPATLAIGLAATLSPSTLSRS